MNLPDPQISDDVLVDTAIDILRSAHVGRVLVRGHDGRCAGLLTSAQLGPSPPTRRTFQEQHPRNVRRRTTAPYCGLRTKVAGVASANSDGIGRCIPGDDTNVTGRTSAVRAAPREQSRHGPKAVPRHDGRTPPCGDQVRTF